MIAGLVQILFFQSVGELLSKTLMPTLPGPVIGLVLLLCWLGWRGAVPTSLAAVADAFSRYLGLLFVPAAVGVVMFLPELRAQGGWIFLTLVVSVVATLAVAAGVLKLWSAWQGDR